MHCILQYIVLQKWKNSDKIERNKMAYTKREPILIDCKGDRGDNYDRYNYICADCHMGF